LHLFSLSSFTRNHTKTPSIHTQQLSVHAGYFSPSSPTGHPRPFSHRRSLRRLRHYSGTLNPRYFPGKFP
jgi:hypothetical protein